MRDKIIIMKSDIAYTYYAMIFMIEVRKYIMSAP